MLPRFARFASPLLLAAAPVLFSACGKDNERRSAEARPRTHVYEYGERVLFGLGGEAERFEIEGWSAMEQEFTWTDGPVASLGCRLRFSRTPVFLHVKAGAMVDPPKLPAQPVEVRIVEPFGRPGNFKVLAHWQIAQTKFYNATIPPQFMQNPDESIVRFEFHIGRPISPAEVGQGRDDRRLGMKVYELVIDRSPEPPRDQ